MSETAASLIVNKTNYTSKDYTTLREELLQSIPILTQGKWTNLNESDPGITMLELFMSMADNLLFYMDMQGQEIDITKARQRVNVIKLLRLIGYEMRGVAAARGLVTLQPSPNQNIIYPIYIEKGAQLTSQNQNTSLVFTTTESTVLSSISDIKTVPVVQGITTTDTFISDGTTSQKFILSSSRIDKESIEVYVDNSPSDTGSLPWNKVSSFYQSNYTSKDYKAQVDEYNRTAIIFGDGQFGKVPALNITITIKYIVSDGALGNVGKDAITQVSSGIPLVQDATGNRAGVSILTSSATAGGADAESIEQAKETATGLLFGLNRALSREDYKALMLSVPGVSKAIAWGENEEQNPDYRLMNRVRVSFFSKDFSDMFYNPATRASYRALRDNQVRKLLLAKMPITTRLVFVDPVLTDIFVTVQIGVNTNKYDPNIVADKIRSAILNYYSLENIFFGQDVRISNILSLANNVQGVSWARVSRLHTTPPTSTPDTAPTYPIDIVLEKWKLPTFSDSIINSPSEVTPNAVPPYIQAITPPNYSLGQNDIIVINPDDQSDILINGFTYYPGTNLQHITVSYTAITDEPMPQGGYYGHPNPEADYVTYSSLE